MKNYAPIIGLMLIASSASVNASIDPITMQNGMGMTKMMPIMAPIMSPAVSRADFVKNVIETLGTQSMQCRRAFNYSDVKNNAHYAAALQVASCSELVKGNPDGSFKPNQAITYAEAAKILTLAFNLPMTREMYPNWYGGYVQTLNRLEANPRNDMQPSDIISLVEMDFMIQALTKAEMSNEEFEMMTDYVGLSIEGAMALAEINNVPFRVTMRDGQFLPATLDYRIGRINASVENDIVVDYTVEGQEEINNEEPEMIADYVGLTLEDAMTLAEANNVPFRVVKLDDRVQPTTRDFRIGRINASVKNGIVTSFEVEGGQ